MDIIEQIRKDLSHQFKHGGGGYKPEPMLDENGKDMLHPMYGKTQSEYQKKWASENAKGNTWRRGSKHTPEAIEKMRETTTGMYDGENNPMWKGGISLGDKRKEYMANWYQKNKKHYQVGGKYAS